MDGSNQQIAPPAEQSTQVAAQDDSAAVMTLIARAASDPAFDVTKLEKLMDLRDRVAAGKAREAFAADFVQMKPHLPTVHRTKSNSQTKTKYAPLESINEAVDPILEKYGFGTSTKIIAQTDKSVTVKAELWHRGGHVEETTITMPLDDRGTAGTVNKTLPHATSSSVTYAKRVAVCALLNISTGDDKDGNGDKAQDGPVTTEQGAEIDNRARGLGEIYHAKFLAWLGVATAIEIKTRDYQKAVNALTEAEAKKAQKAKGAK